MKSTARGMLYLIFAAVVAIGLTAGIGNALWAAGNKVKARSERYAHLAGNKDVVREELEAWRLFSKDVRTVFFVADTAAQAEASFREEIAERVALFGGELTSVQTRPAERGDPHDLLRLRVDFSVDQARLGVAIESFSAEKPLMIINAADMRVASGILRPGVEVGALPLQLSFDVAAFWKSEAQQ